jgi:murein L,D-transpeptidase YcbB/YkuD
MMNETVRLGAIAILLTVGTNLGAPALAMEPDAPTELITEADLAGSKIAERLSLPVADEDERDDRRALAEIYAARRGAPIWFSKGIANDKAKQLVAEIRRADDWGLRASDFSLPDLAVEATAIDKMIDVEVRLSLAALKYARHARGGRLDPSQLSKNLDQKPTLFEPKLLVEALAASEVPDAYLRSLHPKHPQFEKLRQQLLALRRAGTKVERAALAEPVVAIPAGPRLRPGQSHPQIALIRQRLKVQSPPGGDEFYDEALANAVVRFQQEHNQEADATITAATRLALNSASKPATPGANLSRILINMERWRWMPYDLGQFYVWNNIPEFTTRVVKQGKVIHSERIVVGKTDTQTVVFSANMQYIVIWPEWGVPNSIKVKELLPGLRSSTAILQRQNLRVSHKGRPVDAETIDWNAVDPREFEFIQGSGGSNVLGFVKFRFPNKHDIYMHDTPTKTLFNASVRAFSHGCMRVRDPKKLADVILAEDKGWSPAHIQNLISAGPKNNQITLSKPFPVHVTYFTAWVDDEGKLKTAPDLYGHDARIAAVLLEGKSVKLIAQSDPALKAEAAARLPPRSAFNGQSYPRRNSSQNFNFFSAIFSN